MEFKGKMAVLVIMIAVMSSVGGGFLLNAEDVTTCETRFDYVTDVAGAFTGTQEDMYVDYNPQANITGYSVFNPDSGSSANLIHGINYKTTGANGYWIQENTGAVSEHRISVSGSKSTTTPQTGTATVTIDSSSHNAVIREEFGYDNPEVRTVIDTGGGTLVYRTLGITVASLMEGYQADTNSVILSVSGSVNNYPGFFSGIGFDVRVETSAFNRYIVDEVTYSSSASEIRYNPTTRDVRMGTQVVQANEVYLLWGTPERTSVTLDMIIGGGSETRYIDPSKGVQPAPYEKTTSRVVTETLNPMQYQGSIHVPALGAARGNIYVNQSILFDYRVIAGSEESYLEINGEPWWVGRGDVDLFWTAKAGEVTWVRLECGERVTEFSKQWGASYLFEVDVECRQIDRYPVDQVVLRVDYCDSEGTSHEGVSSTGRPLFATGTTYTQSHVETETQRYTETFWSNGYIDTRMTIVFQRPTGSGTVYSPFIIVTDENDEDTGVEVGIVYDDTARQWKATAGFWENPFTNFGDWPAMAMVIEFKEGEMRLYMHPVSVFESFTSYVLLDHPTLLEIDTGWGNDPHGNGVRYLHFTNTDSVPSLFHEVTATTVLLPSGGLYTQDGVFSPVSTFPTDLMSSLRINSVVRCGPMMILETSNTDHSQDVSRAVYTVGDEGWMWNGRTVRWADLSVIYVSDKVEAVSIAGEVYPGALYLGDHTYEKGHLYIRVGNEVTDVGETGPGWTMTLAGTWAFSSAYHTGMNDAASVVQLGEAGVWQWNQEEFLVVFLAVMIAGTIICAWKIGYSAMDWIVTILAAAVIWTLFG